MSMLWGHGDRFKRYRKLLRSGGGVCETLGYDEGGGVAEAGGSVVRVSYPIAVLYGTLEEEKGE